MPVLRVPSVVLLTLVVLAFLFILPADAQGPQNISVVLIIDSSGSMARTDPSNLRFTAARQLVDLLEDGDEISVVLFADDSTVLVSLTKVTDAASKEAIKAGLTSVAPRGNTNMLAGLEAGLAELSEAISAASMDQQLDKVHQLGEQYQQSEAELKHLWEQWAEITEKLEG
ncbi:hypothetical protein LCGC14_0456260 [marine sediment metagenome]|uniref:VWFA domain-containing protein n=1 Tax=marine sediment metagenome TaxID=412755 RepID=A0A0F9V342_9ZZZZ